MHSRPAGAQLFQRFKMSKRVKVSYSNNLSVINSVSFGPLFGEIHDTSKLQCEASVVCDYFCVVERKCCQVIYAVLDAKTGNVSRFYYKMWHCAMDRGFCYWNRFINPHNPRVAVCYRVIENSLVDIVQANKKNIPLKNILLCLNIPNGVNDLIMSYTSSWIVCSETYLSNYFDRVMNGGRSTI